MINTRLYFDESLGRQADETLETIYHQVYFQNSSVEDKKAFGPLLDEYIKRMLPQPIPFGSAAFEYTAAIGWLQNFKGELVGPWNISAGEFHSHKELRKDGCLFGARIEQGRDWSPAVYARTEHDVILLAGIQVLRELSYLAIGEMDYLTGFASTCKH